MTPHAARAPHPPSVARGVCVASDVSVGWGAGPPSVARGVYGVYVAIGVWGAGVGHYGRVAGRLRSTWPIGARSVP